MRASIVTGGELKNVDSLGGEGGQYWVERIWQFSVINGQFFELLTSH